VGLFLQKIKKVVYQGHAIFDREIRKGFYKIEKVLFFLV